MCIYNIHTEIYNIYLSYLSICIHTHIHTDMSVQYTETYYHKKLVYCSMPLVTHFDIFWVTLFAFISSTIPFQSIFLQTRWN